MQNTILSNSNNQTNIQPDSLILSDIMTDPQISWQIHNCKISQQQIAQNQPLPFLYHYDRLNDEQKQTHPLTKELLAKFNQPMLAYEASQLIGLTNDDIDDPWHVKINGSLVVFCEPLQIAVRLQWTNTLKDAQPIYCKDAETALTQAIQHWQFVGQVDVLNKNNHIHLIILDIDKQPHTILASPAYQTLPTTQSIPLLAELDRHRQQLTLFDIAIKDRVDTSSI